MYDTFPSHLIFNGLSTVSFVPIFNVGSYSSLIEKVCGTNSFLANREENGQLAPERFPPNSSVISWVRLNKFSDFVNGGLPIDC